ncbi:MAG: hypothetical protein NWF14_04280 [Candidatus Bathyarchaeota archaeon]|nr:hypothetical protein [Candidatus Bathyarchaeota archaeon]
MEFDVLLPTVVFFIVVTSIFLYRKIQKPVTSLFEDRKFTARDAALIVASMSIMITATVFIPSQAIQITFIAAYSYMLFSFTYIAVNRWYLAIFPPVAFVLAYFLYWELAVFNLFAVIFSVITIVYVSGFFTWKTVWIFAALLTVMDIVQVFGTGFMGQSAAKMLKLKLPVLLIVPTYPTGMLTGLGLGDIFLAGLLAVQTAVRHEQKTGVLTAFTIGIALFIFEVVFLNTTFADFFPATIVVVAGWIAGLGIARMTRLGEQLLAQKTEKKSEESS